MCSLKLQLLPYILFSNLEIHDEGFLFFFHSMYSCTQIVLICYIQLFVFKLTQHNLLVLKNENGKLLNL